jgi:hypothetical protein
MAQQQSDRLVCPVCGRGRLVDVAFDAGTGDRGPGEEPKQLADSSEIVVYDCGHEVRGASVDRADRTLGVETRTSDEPVGDPAVEEPRPHAVDDAG